MNTRFTIPWGDVDPLFQHGGIPGELEGQAVAPDLGDNWSTKNLDNLAVMRELNDIAASLSQHPHIDMEGYPTRDLVSEFLAGVNAVVEKIIDKTRSSANRTFLWTHAIPPANDYAIRPIRYPVRSQFGIELLHYLIGDQVECAELNRNCAHSAFTPQDANKLLAPLFEKKADIMKQYFDLEVSGELSQNEVEQMMNGRYRPGPTVSRPDESGEMPSSEQVIEARTGVDILQWAPDEAAWVKFGDLRDRRYQPERIYQPEGHRSVTEDVAAPNPVTSDGSQLVTSSEGLGA